MSGGGYYQFSFGEPSNAGPSSRKMPLSKAPYPHDQHHSRQRVQHACEPCRRKKSRCDGSRPVCKTCRIAQRECHYGEGKREKTKKRLNEFTELEARNKQYEDFLRDLLPLADDVKRKQIEHCLGENSRQKISSPSTQSSMSQRGQQSRSEKGKSASVSVYESDSNSSEDDYYAEEETRRGVMGVAEGGHIPRIRGGMASMDSSVDRVMDDINTTHVNIPSGFMGKISDVCWISFLYHYLENGNETPDTQYDSTGNLTTPDLPLYFEQSKGKENVYDHRRASPFDPSCVKLMSTHTVVGSYYVDDQDISVGGSPVNHFAIPPRTVADRLTASYFESVQPLCPLVERQEFSKEYERLYMDGDAQTRPWGWLAMLNLVFAMGQTFEDLSRSVQLQDCTTHVEYFTRARILGALDGGLVFRVGTLVQVQVMGLASLYLLATKQANRAWNANGLAIRLAHGLGLHLRNETNTVSPLKREMRNRTWYSLTYIESLLAMVTGRPSCTKLSDCNAPVPKSIKYELSTEYPNNDAQPDPYFLAVMKMNLIFEGVCADIYSPLNGADKSNWKTLRKVIEEYLRKVEHWKDSLPAELNFDRGDLVDEGFRQRNDLFLRYTHTNMIILRPTICHESTLARQTPEMRHFIISHATICVSHALSNIQSLANPPLTITQRLSTIPWWCFLYYLTSSEAIILTDVVFQTTGMKVADDQQIQHFLTVARDGFRWLFTISEANLAGRRCCAMLARLFRLLTKKLGNYNAELEREFGEAIERDIAESIDEPTLELWVTHGPLDFRNRYPA